MTNLHEALTQPTLGRRQALLRGYLSFAFLKCKHCDAYTLDNSTITHQPSCPTWKAIFTPGGPDVWEELEMGPTIYFHNGQEITEEAYEAARP